MSIASVSSTTASATTTPAASTQSMGKDDFLMLLVTQLENQDPLNPMEGTEFTAQLAQFSSLEQLQTISADIEGLKKVQIDQGQSQAVAYLGKSVVAAGNLLDVRSGSTEPIQFELSQPVTTASAALYDSTGRYVRTIDLGSLDAGFHHAAWDGLDTDGNPVADGTFTVSVLAMTESGQTIEAPTFIEGTVTGVDFSSGTALLNVRGLTVALADVRSMQNTE